MICIGLTGGIGSGKSYVAKVFQNLGIPVYNADSRAGELSNSQVSIREKVSSLLGDKAYSQNIMNREWVGRQVFSKPDLLQKLNEIIHPEVELDFQNWVKSQSTLPYIIKEAAILFETGGYQRLHSNILVTAPQKLRIERVRTRDNMDRVQIEKRIQMQWEDEKKIPLADYIIVNDGESLLLPQIINIHKKIIQIR